MQGFVLVKAVEWFRVSGRWRADGTRRRGKRSASDRMRTKPIEQQICYSVGLLIEHPVRAVRCLKAVLTADVAAAVASTATISGIGMLSATPASRVISSCSAPMTRCGRRRSRQR